MKKFILRTVIFIFSTFVLVILIALLPPTPRVFSSLIFSTLKKDSLLINEESPRIILVGGSNVIFGVNSQAIRDAFQINPVNTALTARFGLKYMLDNTCQYVKAGDAIVLIPEYHHFYWEYNWGSEDLLHLIMDVNRSKISLLNLKQIINCSRYIGTLTHSKFNLFEYMTINHVAYYRVNAINQYGDLFAHWNMERPPFEPYDRINPKDYNPDVMKGIKDFEQKIRQKGAVLYISYPSFQDISFDKSPEAIRQVEAEYRKYNFTVLGTPDRYRMHDSLMFNTPYHLNKTGVDYRTELLIEDLKTEFASAKHLR
jgi:hypothetical protein